MRIYAIIISSNFKKSIRAMNKYQIIKEESEIIDSSLKLMVRVEINDIITHKPNIDLLFDDNLIKDYFYNIPMANENNRLKIRERVIELLHYNSNELLNKLMLKVLENKNIKTDIEKRKIGQYTVEDIDFDCKDYRVIKL